MNSGELTLRVTVLPMSPKNQQEVVQFHLLAPLLPNS